MVDLTAALPIFADFWEPAENRCPLLTAICGQTLLAAKFNKPKASGQKRGF
jgi:hypothetical protein